MVNVAQESPTAGKVSALKQSRVFFALLGLVGMIVVLALLSPVFLTVPNLLNILTQVSIIAIVSVGMTYVIITGGINLSLSGILALASVVCALLLKQGVHSFLAMFLALGTGVLFGLAGGILVTGKFQLPPFIATLALQSVARGLTMVITRGETVYGIPQPFFFWGGGYLLGIPVPAIIMLLIFSLGYYNLAHTKSGVYFYAVGGNQETTRLAGIDANRVKWVAYTISGIMAAIGGILLTSRLMSVEPLSGLGYDMDAIAAAVIGGVSLSGGEGSLLGTLLGALIMGVLRNGLNLLSVSTYWQQVMIGVVIAVTVAVGAARSK